MADQITEASLKLGGDWATKEGSLLGFNDQNGNYKPIPFDFTRATTATRVNRDGLIEEVQSGVPRIDFLDNPDGSLLLEPQRTNFQTYSEEFNDSVWTKSNVSITADNTVSPDGSQTADLCNYTSSASYINTGFASTGNTDVTISVFVKANTVSTFRIRESFYTGVSCVYDLSAGSAGSGGTIQEYLNDWYRCTFTYTLGSGQTNINYIFDLNTNVGSVYLWGAQVEAGSYATSYIKTSGSAVTRNADVCNNAQTTFNDSEGVLYAEIAALFAAGTSRRITLSDGTSSNRIVIENDETSGRYRFFISGGGTTVELPNVTGQTETNFNKIAIYWNGVNSKIFFNGTQNGSTETGTPTISGLSTIQFEQAAGGSSYFYGNCKELRVYNTALTDTELEELTTL